MEIIRPRRVPWLLCAAALMALAACGGPGATPNALPAGKVEDVVATDVPATPTATAIPSTEVPLTAMPAPVDETLEPTEEVEDTVEPETGGVEMALTLTSTSFVADGRIPALYTCDGQDISPALAWEGMPPETESFALIMDDPDASVGTWVHWVIYNIPAGAGGLAEALPGDPELPDGSLQGQNSWPRSGYGGPCPPSGTHRYFFKLYALDTSLALAPDRTDKATLLDAIAGHVIAEATLMGTYQR